jgi:hypothetical protein
VKKSIKGLGLHESTSGLGKRDLISIGILSKVGQAVPQKYEFTLSEKVFKRLLRSAPFFIALVHSSGYSRKPHHPLSGVSLSPNEIVAQLALSRKWK